MLYYLSTQEVRHKYRGVEQLEARRAHNPEVVGSSPASATRKDTRLDTISSLVFLFYVGMIPGMGCCSNFFHYIDFWAA